MNSRGERFYERSVVARLERRGLIGDRYRNGCCLGSANRFCVFFLMTRN